MNKGSTTPAHEYGHGLGLRHHINPDGSFETLNGQPDIMAVPDNKVDVKYEENVTRRGFSAPYLDINKRKVTQRDIDDLHLNTLQYDKDGKAKLGQLSNLPHK